MTRIHTESTSKLGHTLHRRQRLAGREGSIVVKYLLFAALLTGLLLPGSAASAEDIVMKEEGITHHPEPLLGRRDGGSAQGDPARWTLR
jgi:hypothetical protein